MQYTFESAGCFVATDRDGREYPFEVIDEFQQSLAFSGDASRFHVGRKFEFRATDGRKGQATLVRDESDKSLKGQLKFTDLRTGQTVLLASNDPLADSYDVWQHALNGEGHG